VLPFPHGPPLFHQQGEPSQNRSEGANAPCSRGQETLLTSETWAHHGGRYRLRMLTKQVAEGGPKSHQ
jgi:hypothetical protein